MQVLNIVLFNVKKQNKNTLHSKQGPCFFPKWHEEEKYWKHK